MTTKTYKRNFISYELWTLERKEKEEEGERARYLCYTNNDCWSRHDRRMLPTTGGQVFFSCNDELKVCDRTSLLDSFWFFLLNPESIYYTSWETLVEDSPRALGIGNEYQVRARRKGIVSFVSSRVSLWVFGADRCSYIRYYIIFHLYSNVPSRINFCVCSNTCGLVRMSSYQGVKEISRAAFPAPEKRLQEQ